MVDHTKKFPQDEGISTNDLKEKLKKKEKELREKYPDKKEAIEKPDEESDDLTTDADEILGD